MHLYPCTLPIDQIYKVVRLFIGVVLTLLCFVLFNDCVQPCIKPKTIQPNSIIDLDSIVCIRSPQLAQSY